MFSYFLKEVSKAFKALLYFVSYLFYFIGDTIDDFMNGINRKKCERLIFFDFETTGLNMFHDKIIEYCFQDAYDQSKSIQSLIDPERKFEFIITKITGIYPDDLVGKPKIYEKINEIVDFINPSDRHDTYLVAHNVDGFDSHILRSNIKEYAEEYVASHYTPNIWRGFKYIDTLILAKKLNCIPSNKYSLKAICEHYNITPGNHRADGDTDALIQAYKMLLEELSTTLMLDAEFLYENPYLVYEYIYG